MKEKILRATAKIIAQDGIKAASTRTICDAVGITAPTLYYYFEDKSELLKAVTSFAFDQHMNHLNLENTGGDFAAELRRAWDLYIDFAITQTELYRTMVISVAQGQVLESGFKCFCNLARIFEMARHEGLTKYDAIESSQIYLSAAQGLALTMLTLPNRDPEKINILSTNTREVVLGNLMIANSVLETA